MFKVGEIVASEVTYLTNLTNLKTITHYETISEINTIKNQIITFNPKEDSGNYRHYHTYNLTNLYILGYNDRERINSYRLRKLTLKEKIKLCLK